MMPLLPLAPSTTPTTKAQAIRIAQVWTAKMGFAVRKPAGAYRMGSDWEVALKDGSKVTLARVDGKEPRFLGAIDKSRYPGSTSTSGGRSFDRDRTKTRIESAIGVPVQMRMKEGWGNLVEAHFEPRYGGRPAYTPDRAVRSVWIFDRRDGATVSFWMPPVLKLPKVTAAGFTVADAQYTARSSPISTSALRARGRWRLDPISLPPRPAWFYSPTGRVEPVWRVTLRGTMTVPGRRIAPSVWVLVSEQTGRVVATMPEQRL